MESLSRPLFALILIAIFSVNFVSAANSSDVIINEIAWMGTEASANDEWIELYNNTPQAIDLSGWILKGTSLTGTIPAQGFYLLERTDDQTVPNVPADQIYTGALSNQGMDLELYDNAGNLINFVSAKGGWLAGDNSTKQTMERKDANAWQTSQDPGGTPKAKNSPGQVLAKTNTPEAPPLLNNKLAAVSEPIQQTQNKQTHEPLLPFLAALAVAVFSVAIILVLKNKVKIG